MTNLAPGRTRTIAARPALRATAQRVWLVLLSALLLASGCGTPPRPEILHPVGTTATGSPVEVLAATTRARSAADSRDFTAERDWTISHQRYVFSIPPTHQPGRIEAPHRFPGNPETDFVVTESAALDDAQFYRDVAHATAGSGEVVIFVHGYNTSYEKAVLQAALMRHEGKLGHFAMVAFAWPSRSSLTGYVTDREASTYSRDHLEQMLIGLARTPGIKRINIIAHSMGNWLTMEVLRQARLRGGSPIFPKLGAVYLMSPDIDIYVFGAQLNVVGKLNPPLTVALSADDKALAFSQWLAGDVPRVGNVMLDQATATSVADHYGLRLLDMTRLETTDTINHRKFIDLLVAFTQSENTRRPDHLATVAGLFVISAAGKILSGPSQTAN